MKTLFLSILFASAALAQLSPISVPNAARLTTTTPTPGRPVLVEGGLVQGDGRGTGGWYIVTNISGTNIFVPAWIAQTGGLLTGASSLAQLQDLNWYPLARRHAFMIATVTNTGAQYVNDLTLTNWYNTGSVSNMAQLRLIEPGVGGTVTVDSYYGTNAIGGGTYSLTNSVSGTNTYGGMITALGGAKSWILLDTEPNVRQFGALNDGATDNTLFIQSALDYCEDTGLTTLHFPPGLLTYKWSTVTNRICEMRGGYGAGYNGTLVEQTTGVTNHFVVLNPPAPSAARFYAPTAGPQPSVRDFTMIGHSEGNTVNPKSITAVTDRLNFSVATGDLPYTGGVLLTNTYPYLGHVFFYSSLNKYCGYGIITNINYGTGLITLMDYSDNYATPTNSGGVLTNTMKVCFSQVVTESSAFSTETFIDGATAGTCGIYVTSTDTASVSSKILIENVNVYGFHCGIRMGSVLLHRIKGVETKFCAYAGYADANPGNSRDGSLNDVFVFGKYQPNFNANEGGVTESVTYDNPGFRAPAYGFYGLVASGEALTCAVNFTVNGVYVKNLASTRVSSFLVEGVIGPAIWLDGSKFGDANQTATFTDFELRTLATNEVAFPTLTSYTNYSAVYYKNSGVGSPNYTFKTLNFSRLASTHKLFDHGINLVNSDGQFAFESVARTNGISGTFLSAASATPATVIRYNVDGITGMSVFCNTYRLFGKFFGQQSGAANLFSLLRSDTGSGLNINFGSSLGNIVGTNLVGFTFESSGPVIFKDTDANKSAALRGQSFGGGTTDTSYLEPLFNGSDNLLQWGGGSSGAYVATLQDFVVGGTTTTTTGTKVMRLSPAGIRVSTTGIAGSTSADAPFRIDSTTGGILPPRMTKVQRDAISTPTDGLFLYQSDGTAGLKIRIGGAWYTVNVTADP